MVVVLARAFQQQVQAAIGCECAAQQAPGHPISTPPRSRSKPCTSPPPGFWYWLVIEHHFLPTGLHAVGAGAQRDGPTGLVVAVSERAQS